MSVITWDATGERIYETGVDHGVLYLPDTSSGVYDTGFAWNGLVTVTESPSGAESSAQFADNIKYLNLVSAEEFGATIEAFTYPEEFAECDGTAAPQVGITVGQQNRRPFGLCYRSLIGNDIEGTAYGYKLHLIYGAQAAPSERAYGTVNDSPEAITFSWEVTTTPVGVTDYKPTASITVDSTKVDSDNLEALQLILYGDDAVDPRLPLPDEVIALFGGTVTEVTPTTPTFVSATGVITIPSVTGVQYRRSDTNAVVTGTVTIATSGATLVITANPTAAHVFSSGADDDWSFHRD